MNTHSVKEVRESLIGLESYILNALRAFEENNDVSVENVSLSHINNYGAPRGVKKVSIDVDIKRY